MNDNDAIVAEILSTIHNSNDIQENHCTIDKKGIGFESHNYSLGDKTIDIEIVKNVFDDLAINCNRSSCVAEKSNFALEKEGAFIKFIFSSYTDDKKTDVLEIIVEEKYADEFANWLFADSWDYLMTKDTRTSKQKAALKWLVGGLVVHFGASVHGHNEYSDKACPCFDVGSESWGK